MTLEITIPRQLRNERIYIIDILLHDFLGIQYEIIGQSDIKAVQIVADNRQLRVYDYFFRSAAKTWLNSKSLPELPLQNWNSGDDLPEAKLVMPKLPVIFGESFYNKSYLSTKKNKIQLKLDIFGSAFFMLSRYEEAVERSFLDAHNRFPAKASLSDRSNFLLRPIVNEYVEILWACLKRLWPQLSRRPRQFRTLLSHDIDYPYFYPFMNFGRIGKRVALDLFRYRSVQKPLKRYQLWLQAKHGQLENDPYNSFDHMMRLSESHNLQSAFHFITDRPAGVLDCRYTMEHPIIRRLIRNIYNRGHEIGLHPSYNSYQDLNQTVSEFQKLRRICEQEGVKQKIWGSRQHYLRWETPTTVVNLDKAGLNYDSTLGFAEKPGFRCGTCYEYPAYDLCKHKSLQIRERPLIVMECSVIDERYMNMGTGEKAYAIITKLKDICRRYNGDFTLLWHNTHLTDHSEIVLYKEILNA